MYKLREVNKRDYEAISLLNNNSENLHLNETESTIDKDFFDQMLLHESIRWYAVENSGQLLAFVLFRLETATKTIYIEKLTVDLAFKKKGLDEHLYSKVERLAERSGFITMKTEISTANLEVYDFFERKGWMQADNSVYVLKVKS